MTIAQLADATGVSKHTLRYYERLGLIPLVARDRSSGHRQYSDQHGQWITFVRRLRESGMPIRELRTYAALVAKGEHTWPARRSMLAAHRARVDTAIALLRRQRSMLDKKLTLGCAPAGLGAEKRVS
jgi:DNA-binding transcriptional MerR regulator